MAERELTGGLVHTPFLQGLPNLISEQWRRYFSAVATKSNQVPTLTRVTVAARNSAIGVTPIPAGVLNGGLYRITVYTRIVAAAVTSSSVQPLITFTDDADVCTMAGTPVTDNTPTTVGTSVFLVRIDPGSPISYSTSYASNGAGQMQYELELVLEQIG